MENVDGSQSPGFFSVLKECARKDPFALADPRGAPGTRAPPGGPNSFIFMQFSAKN